MKVELASIVSQTVLLVDFRTLLQIGNSPQKKIWAVTTLPLDTYNENSNAPFLFQ